MSGSRVVLAMSGGVDSTVSAHLLVEQGFDVVGLFMRTGAGEPQDACETGPAARRPHGCCSARDAADARQAADRLDVPFYALNFAEEFDRIQDYFVDEYLRGRTPNPCAVCNTWLKFGKLWEYADAVGAEYVATGHYARILPDSDGEFGLHTAVDPAKDQSYFLFGVRADRLSRTRFPIGHLTKKEVRGLAVRYGLNVAAKPDSQEICFVPSGDYQDVIRRRRPETLEEGGEIVDVEGRAVASHAGVSRFTVGQRKGLGVALGEPRYVLEIRPETRQVVIGPRELLAQRVLQVENVQWLLAQPPAGPICCRVKIRYLHQAADAVVHPAGGDRARVEFDDPQFAIAPGQAAVFYRETRVLGGGWIERSEPGPRLP